MHKQYLRNTQGVMVPQKRQHFSYTDGAQEERRIAQIIAQASDRSAFSPEFLQASTDWVTNYHLSPQRTYLLRPIQHLLSDKKILELGAGCGALTRYMGEHARRVIALEGSPARADITAARCKGLQNVTVINDTIQDLYLPQQFDIVTLIGVLEYARMYDSSSESPERAILRKAHDFLKPEGHLLLAIENKLGLKYLAGAKEDHVGKPFFGVHGLYGRDTVVTFGRFELEKLLRQAGFHSLTQLIPLPDYKLPVTVLHPPSFDGSSPAMNIYPLALNSIIYDLQSPSNKCFSLESTYKTVIENGLLPELCNSLYYIASRENAPEPLSHDILTSHYGGKSYKEFAQETLLIRDSNKLYVKKRHLYDGISHKNDVVTNSLLQNQDYSKHVTLYEKLIPVLNTPGWTVSDLAAWASPWIDYLRSLESSGNLPPSSLDMTPANFFVDESGNLMPFDCEWSLTNDNSVPLNYIAMRGLFIALHCFSNVAPPAKNVTNMTIPLIIDILSKNNLCITENDVKFLLYKFAEFTNATGGTQINLNYILNSKLTVRELQ